MSLSRLTTRQTLYDRFAVPDGAVVLNIPRSKLEATWNGRRLPPSVMGMYRSGLDHWVMLPAGWDGYEFTVSERLLRQLELLPEGLFKKTRQFEDASLPLMEPVTGTFLAQLDRAFAVARNGKNNGVVTESDHQLFDIVIHGLLEILDAGLIAVDKHALDTARRPDLVKKATDLVEARLKSNLSIQDMVEELNVSARVLNYAFKDNLGVSPYRYILARKLHAVNRELKSSEEPIVDIISRYRFSTPSRFNRQYLRMFGELPSSTRQRRE